MNMFTKAGIVAIGLILVVIGYSYYNYIVPTFFPISLSRHSSDGSKPSMADSILSNPDFIYPESGWITQQFDEDLKDEPYLTQFDWDSDGWYENTSFYGKTDIILIHPKSEEIGRYIEQEMVLEEGNYKLFVGVSNNRNYILDPQGLLDVGYGDVVILVKVKDVSNDRWYTESFVVDSNDGWKDLEYELNINQPSADVVIRVESKAGGSHSSWDGEWAAVDYIYLANA